MSRPAALSLSNRFAVPVLAAAGLIAGAAVLVSLRPHGPIHLPDVSLIWAQKPAVQVHLLTAVAAFLLGSLMFMTRKGATFHRVAGWTWVILMAAVAGSSLLITGLNGDFYSWIHLLSGWTLFILPLAVMAARRHDVKAHRRRMTGLFLGGMIIAGAFTFFPGRLMWALFFR